MCVVYMLPVEEVLVRTVIHQIESIIWRYVTPQSTLPFWNWLRKIKCLRRRQKRQFSCQYSNHLKTPRPDGQKAKNISQVMELIALDDLPISMAEDMRFRQLIANEPALPYWNGNKGLAIFGQRYLSAPCMSTDSERLFSAASHVVDRKRNCLSCDKAKMLLFVKKNLPLVFRVKPQKLTSPFGKRL